MQMSVKHKSMQILGDKTTS